MSVTTIKLRKDTKRELDKHKSHARETYEDIVLRLLAVYKATHPEVREQVDEDEQNQNLREFHARKLDHKELIQRIEKRLSDFPQ